MLWSTTRIDRGAVLTDQLYHSVALICHGTNPDANRSIRIGIPVNTAACNRGGGPGLAVLPERHIVCRVISEANMMHGRHWRGQDVRGWLASEKLDGCRGYWSGERMWSRSGRAFAIPDKWRLRLPRKLHLEGEIWAGRGNFELTVRAVVNNQWDARVCFIVFDAPNAPGAWGQRLNVAAKRLRGRFAATIPFNRVRDVQHLARLFQSVGADSGEDLMLRCPKSVGYSPGRCDRVLKLCRDPITGYVPPGRVVVEQRMEMARRAA